MSTAPDQILWTKEDAKERRCRFIDVGTPRIEEAPEPEPNSPPPLPNLTEEDLDQLPAKLLKRDALRAYQRLGGAEWLSRQPGLLGKVLLKMLPNEILADERKTLDVRISWAGPDRLSYQAKDIVDVEVVGPTRVPDHTPWKPIDRDTTAHNLNARMDAELEAKGEDKPS